MAADAAPGSATATSATTISEVTPSQKNREKCTYCMSQLPFVNDNPADRHRAFGGGVGGAWPGLARLVAIGGEQ